MTKVQYWGTDGKVYRIPQSDPLSNTKLIKIYIENNNIYELERILKANPNLINIDVFPDKTPINFASSEGRMDIVKILYEMGADINIKGDHEWNYSPVENAIFHGYDNIAKFLIDKGASTDFPGGKDANSDNIEKKLADHIKPKLNKLIQKHISNNNLIELEKILKANPYFINMRINENLTPLLSAAMTKKLDVVKLLLNNGADIKAKTSGGVTALEFAIIFGNHEIVTTLINKGASLDFLNYLDTKSFSDAEDLRKRSVKTELPIIIKKYIEDNNIIELKKIFEVNENLNFINMELSLGETPIIVAARSGKTKIVELLLNYYYFRDYKNLDIDKALEIAIENNYNEMAKFLLDKGAKIDLRNGIDAESFARARGNNDIADYIAIPKCMKDGNVDKFKEIIERNPGIIKKLSIYTIRDIVSNHHENYGIIELLINEGATIDHENFNNDTPLKIAIEKKYNRVAKLLIDKNAELDFGKEGEAENFSRLHDNSEIAEYIKNKKNEIMIDNVEKGQVGKVKAIIKLDRNLVNITDKKSGFTPLMIAVTKNNPSMAGLLLDSGANINYKDKKGKTALFYAIDKNSNQAAKFLIDKGADLYLENIVDAESYARLHNNNEIADYIESKRNLATVLAGSYGSTINLNNLSSKTYRSSVSDIYPTLNSTIYSLNNPLRNQDNRPSVSSSSDIDPKEKSSSWYSIAKNITIAGYRASTCLASVIPAKKIASFSAAAAIGVAQYFTNEEVLSKFGSGPSLAIKGSAAALAGIACASLSSGTAVSNILPVVGSFTAAYASDYAMSKAAKYMK